MKNQVRFITFNYDTSLEFHLFRALSSIDLLKQEHIREFLGNDRVIHVYGSVRTGIPTTGDAINLAAARDLGKPFSKPLIYEQDFLPRSEFLDTCLTASETLRTIDPQDKEDDADALQRAREWITNSGIIYILGYGFDESNSSRLGFSRDMIGDKSILFTNFLDTNTVNKRASRLFFGSHEKLLNQSSIGHPRKGLYVEKSIRTVYEALEKDFDTLEEQLIATTKI